MKIYRVADTRAQLSEGTLMDQLYIMAPCSHSSNEPYGCTTFSPSRIDNGKYFFIDFLDAVKYNAFYYPIPYFEASVFALEVPDSMIKGNIGIGYYVPQSILGLSRNDFFSFSPSLFSKYFALELLIPYEQLHNSLSIEKSESNRFKLSCNIERYDIKSLEFQNALELLKERGSLPYYQSLVQEALNIFKCRYKKNYSKDRPFKGHLDYNELAHNHENLLYDIFLRASLEAVTEDSVVKKLK